MSAGIDYGMGQSNVDKETGIRYGVIHQNKISCFARDDMYQDGEDVEFESFKEAVKDSLKRAIENALEEHGLESCNDSEEFAENIVDSLEFDTYEQTADCQRVHYEKDGYEIDSLSDGDMFITKSEFYTLCKFCSPCAPGAGSLSCPDEDGIKAYCLAKDWFDDEVAPYPVYRVSDDSLVE
jgi:hypothetical protein